MKLWNKQSLNLRRCHQFLENLRIHQRHPLTLPRNLNLYIRQCYLLDDNIFGNHGHIKSGSLQDFNAMFVNQDNIDDKDAEK